MPNFAALAFFLFRDDGAKLFEFSKIDEDGPSRASKAFNTRFPEYPWCSVCHAAIQNRGVAPSLGLGVIKGWERGALQSCSLFQDGKILLHLARNSRCSENPEIESKVDSPLSDSSLVASTIRQF